MDGWMEREREREGDRGGWERRREKKIEKNKKQNGRIKQPTSAFIRRISCLWIERVSIIVLYDRIVHDSRSGVERNGLFIESITKGVGEINGAMILSASWSGGGEDERERRGGIWVDVDTLGRGGINVCGTVTDRHLSLLERGEWEKGIWYINVSKQLKACIQTSNSPTT